jgi:hypothetical protein
MLQRRYTTDSEELQKIADAMTEANLHYLCHCVSFWLAVKPTCGVKDWLEYSIRRSTHRLATDGLRETIARLTDEDLLWMHERMGR